MSSIWLSWKLQISMLASEAFSCGFSWKLQISMLAREVFSCVLPWKSKFFTMGCVLLLGLGGVGCATTEATPVQTNAVSAVAKAGNTYVVRRAAVRTASTVRRQHTPQQKRVQRPAPGGANRAVQPRRFPGQLTKAQYHARYQAQKRAAAEAAAERRRAEMLEHIARKKAEEAAIRGRYVSKWQQAQQKRIAHNKSWQQEQLAKQRRAEAAARKAAAQRKLAARQPVMPKKVVTAAVRKPTAQKKVWARKPVPQRKRVVAQKRPDPRAKYLARWERMQAEKRLEAKRAEQRVERVIHNAKQQIGRKYVWGGASPKQGFDCSGLVQHSINKGANVSVPRTALQQYRASTKVPAHQAERGDLIFFITRGKQVSHVGLYLGDNKFVHAPRTGRTVTTSRLKGYWKKRFVGFGRIPGACRLPMPKA